MRGKGGRFWCGLADCAMALEDEVFEEEESAEVLGDSARPCHPDYVRGRRIETRRAFRQAVLQYPVAEESAPPSGPKMAPKWPKMAPRWTPNGPRWPQRRPRWAPRGPKRGPKSLPNRSSKAFQHRSRKRETPHQSETPILVVFGPLLEPI